MYIKTKMIMKNKIIAGFSIIAVLLTACRKDADPVDRSNATVTLENAGAKFVTGDVTVNPGDSILFSYTITSDKEMKYVGIQKNPVNQTAFVARDTLTSASSHSFTAVKRLKADTVNGSFVYRIVAHDASGAYIGHKDLVVTVTTDYDFFTYRFLRVPDTVEKVNTCYMASKTGDVYSYTTGAANSAAIDFGMYFDTTGAQTPSTTDDLKFCLYALSAPQPQLSFYDISSWTKNATAMKKVSSPAFNTLTSGGALRSAGKTNLASGTATKINNLANGELVYFKTAAGKIGCLQVTWTNNAGASRQSYMTVDVKVER
jgi:hypothetical protein